MGPNALMHGLHLFSCIVIVSIITFLKNKLIAGGFMKDLIPGQNCQLDTGNIIFNASAALAADYSAYVLGENGKTSKDEDFLFYGNRSNLENTVKFTIEGSKASFFLDLKNMPSQTKKVVFAVTPEAGKISVLKSINFKLEQSGGDDFTGAVDCMGREEGALIIGEVYRHKDGWKYRFIAQGFNGGLKPLAEYYGVEISEDVTPPQAPPRKEEIERKNPPSKINLSKITLTKEQPRISLEKKGAGRGVYKVNLNWNTKPKTGNGGFLSGIFGGNKGIDLDLAAYVQLKNGRRFIIQALGETFGNLDYPPYVKLLGDDRTGAQSEGEWLEINGKHIDEIEEIIIFTFIYEGVANWNETDGKVTLYIGDNPPVETILTEGNNRLPMCAIARIRNEGNGLSIERLNRYFSGHKDMDKAYGWGFNWVRGEK